MCMRDILWNIMINHGSWNNLGLFQGHSLLLDQLMSSGGARISCYGGSSGPDGEGIFLGIKLHTNASMEKAWPQHQKGRKSARAL